MNGTPVNGQRGPELEQQARERLLDAALAEIASEAAPRAVGAHGPRAGARWVAAALIVLGLGVAVAIALLQRIPTTAPAEEPVRTPAQDPAPELPAEVRIEDPAALATLDRGTANLFLCVLQPADLAPLSEFAALRRLVLEPSGDTPPLHLRLRRGDPDAEVAAWTLASLGKCTKLESLTIGLLRGFRSAALVDVASLPALREVGLVGVDHLVDADFVAALAKLELRSLSLSAVRIDPKAFAALCELPLLERLELSNCLHLDRCDLALLGRLRNLKGLALRGVGARLADSLGKSHPLPGMPETPPPPEPKGDGAIFRSGLQMAGENKLVLTVAAMRALGGLPALRELDLGGSVVADAVLQALPPTITDLGLIGAIGLTPDGVRAIAELRGLVAFGCSNFAVDDDLLQGIGQRHPTWEARYALTKARRLGPLEVIRQHQLHRLTFHGSMSAELATALTGQPELRDLEIVLLGEKDPKPDVGFVATLPKLERLSITGAAWFDPEPLADCKALRYLRLARASEMLVDSARNAVGPEVVVDTTEKTPFAK